VKKEGLALRFVAISVVVAAIWATVELLFACMSDGSITWRELPIAWLACFGLCLAIVAYVFFVGRLKETRVPAPLRHLAFGLVLGGGVGIGVWLFASFREDALWWALGAFVLGLFAEKWVENL
jgi:hypothetical protein